MWSLVMGLVPAIHVFTSRSFPKVIPVIHVLAVHRQSKTWMAGTKPGHDGAESLSVVMPGRVPGIHVFAMLRQGRRGWPGRSPAMTEPSHFQSSCPGLSRASTSWRCFGKEDVDGRDEARP